MPLVCDMLLISRLVLNVLGHVQKPSRIGPIALHSVGRPPTSSNLALMIWYLLTELDSWRV